MNQKPTKFEESLDNSPPAQTDTTEPIEEAGNEHVDSANTAETNAEDTNAGDESPITDVSANDLANGSGNAFAADSKAQLLEKLADAYTQIEKLKEGYIRAKADVENIRRRSQNEIISARKYAIDGFAQELLSVADSLDQATRVEMSLSEGANEGAVIKMKEGLELTLKQFNKAMEKFGVTAVEAAPGIKFNPEIHQAISVFASAEIAPEHILEVMQKGFLLKDRLLRPAMVVIAKPADE